MYVHMAIWQYIWRVNRAIIRQRVLFFQQSRGGAFLRVERRTIFPNSLEEEHFLEWRGVLFFQQSRGGAFLRVERHTIFSNSLEEARFLEWRGVQRRCVSLSGEAWLVGASGGAWFAK